MNWWTWLENSRQNIEVAKEFLLPTCDKVQVKRDELGTELLHFLIEFKEN